MSDDFSPLAIKWVGGISTPIILAGVKIIRDKYFNNWKKLREHSVFAKFLAWSLTSVSEKEISDHKKRDMATLFLNLNFMIWHKELEALVENKGTCKKCSTNCPVVSMEQFTCFIQHVITDKNKAYVEAGIPQYFLDSFEERYNRENTLAMITIIEDTLKSSRSLAKNLYLIYSAFQNNMRIKRFMAVNIINDMNGKLTDALKEKK